MKKVLTPEIVDKAKILKEQGFNRKQIAETIHVSYGTIARLFGPERLGIDRSNKVPWTIENLKKLQEVYKSYPPREVCLMFNRDRYEIRQLLSHLGWEIPPFYFNKNKEEIKKQIIELSEKYNIREISKLLGVSFSLVQSICSENNIQVVKTRNNIKRIKKEQEELSKPKKLTPSEIMREAYAESARLFKEKFKQKE